LTVTGCGSGSCSVTFRPSRCSFLSLQNPDVPWCT